LKKLHTLSESLKNKGKTLNHVAIREETIRRRRRFASKTNMTKNDRRSLEETKVNPPPERYEEDQPNTNLK
jgi:hypothetical protein